jgi:hypothetical protein
MPGDTRPRHARFDVPTRSGAPRPEEVDERAAGLERVGHRTAVADGHCGPEVAVDLGHDQRL